MGYNDSIILINNEERKVDDKIAIFHSLIMIHYKCIHLN